MTGVGFVPLAAPLPLRQQRGGGICGTRRRDSHRACRRQPPVIALFGRNKTRRPQGFALADAPAYRFAELDGLQKALGKPGAYAVRDASGVLQYVGYAKDVQRRLCHHFQAVPEFCGSFHTYVPDLPKSDVTPELLEGVLEYWVAENGGMPVGNTQQRGLWESFGKQQQQQQVRATQTSTAPDPTIPVRERTTPRRRATRTNAENMGSVAGVGATTGVGVGGESWSAREEDVIELNVDPLDPFTATKYASTTRQGLWDATGGEGDGEDWIPIFGVVGVATVIWLLSVLGNALPTAAPSLGM